LPTYVNQSDNFTSPEPQPVGLAAAIYAGVSVLHWEGEVTTVEPEPTMAIGLGNVLNLTGSRAVWATMVALIQRIEVDIGQGLTMIQVGWPHQLMPADLAQLWRVNRTRQQVQDQAVRTTGITGSADDPQPMGHKHVPSTGSAHSRPAGVFTAPAQPAGTVPAFSDFVGRVGPPASGLAAIYAPGVAGAATFSPVSGDTINFTAFGATHAVGWVSGTASGGGGLFNGSFPAGGRTWYISIFPVGNYSGS
jgi:hypothetical protein